MKFTHSHIFYLHSPPPVERVLVRADNIGYITRGYGSTSHPTEGALEVSLTDLGQARTSDDKYNEHTGQLPRP